MEKQGFVLIGRIREIQSVLKALASLEMELSNLTGILNGKCIVLKKE